MTQMPSLKDLGLSEYESKIYTSLLDIGTATAKELSEYSGVPMGRVYDVLSSLESNNLIRSQTASRPKKYVAVEPETALDRLVEKKHEEIQQEIERYETIANELKQTHSITESLDDRFWTAAIGPRDALNLYLERLKTADERVLYAAEPVAGEAVHNVIANMVLDEYEKKVEEGVEIYILLTPSHLDAHNPETLERVKPLRERENYHVRVSDEVNGAFNIIDDEEVCINIRNPLFMDPNSQNEYLAMINIRDHDFVADMTREYWSYWETATPLEDN
ncbi:MAG: helix-turn-helix domain-containing protein [Halobacteria archaeon]|nr:helix-turn-helix domain-containing protein [Halobacteria archaeon]